MPEPVAPSGRQYEIVSGPARVTVVEVGGGLRTYRVGDRDVLDGYGVDEMTMAARGQPLIPWPNRLEDGRYTFDGEEYQTPLSEPAKHNAIHGFLRFANWQVAERADDAIAMGIVLHPRPGYPFALAVRIDYRLAADGLTVTTTATNVGSRPCPYGSGQHPYLRVGTPTVDEDTLQLDAQTWLPTDDRGLPTGRSPVGGSPYDFRQPRPIGDTEIDTAFTDLGRDEDGRAWVWLAAPDGPRVGLWVDEGYPFVELFTGDTLPSRQRQGLGVEPMTCPPNAFRTGTDVRRLEPGAEVRTSWGIRAG